MQDIFPGYIVVDLIMGSLCPQLWKRCRGILLWACPSARPSICVSVQNLLRYSSKISCMDSSSKIIDRYLLKSGLSPFVELCPFEMVTMLFCNQDISKIITAMSFKFGQLIENNE